MFSLCIPTIDRYDSFLKENIKKYLENPLIDEIIITDENGNDIDKIDKEFSNNKLKLFKNEKKLGMFFNKLKCCSFANKQWIALIDSDNFADLDYFSTAEKYINDNNLVNETILTPSFAKQNFDYREFQNTIVNKNNLKDMLFKYKIFTTFLNTGNYIINKFLTDNIKIENQEDSIYNAPTDGVLFYTLLFEQFDLNVHVIKDMHYTHTVHGDSTYIQTESKYKREIDIITNKIYHI